MRYELLLSGKNHVPQFEIAEFSNQDNASFITFFDEFYITIFFVRNSVATVRERELDEAPALSDASVTFFSLVQSRIYHW